MQQCCSCCKTTRRLNGCLQQLYAAAIADKYGNFRCLSRSFLTKQGGREKGHKGGRHTTRFASGCGRHSRRPSTLNASPPSAPLLRRCAPCPRCLRIFGCPCCAHCFARSAPSLIGSGRRAATRLNRFLRHPSVSLSSLQHLSPHCYLVTHTPSPDVFGIADDEGALLRVRQPLEAALCCRFDETCFAA